LRLDFQRYRAENVFGSLISGDTAENIFRSLISMRFQYAKINYLIALPTEDKMKNSI
jgi:hypothetical protein